MNMLLSWTHLILVAHIMIIIGVTVRVIMMRLAVSTALAWIILIFFLPFAGALIYLVLGEKHLGRPARGFTLGRISPVVAGSAATDTG